MDEIINFFTEREFLGNEVWRFALLLAAIFVGLVAGRLGRFIIENVGKRLKAEGKQRTLGMFCVCLGRPMTLFGLVLGLRLGLASLRMNDSLDRIAEACLNTLFAVAVGYAIYQLVDILDEYLTEWAAKTDTKLDDMLVPLVRKSIRITLVVVVAMFILQQIAGAKRIGTLLAGLGVGGLAVALAAQDTIKNFFGSLMILADKPFEVGDRVVIGDHDGPVEEVGFRSTKIRTLDGHLVTIPNSTVVNAQVRNIGRRPYIRRLANITITYDTPPDKVLRAVEILKDILDNHEGMRPDFPPRVFFNDFNADSLNILVLYWFHPPDYWDYQAFSQKVNMEILERFNAEGIEFAFPTQTLFLANDDRRQLAVRLLGQDFEATKA